MENVTSFVKFLDFGYYFGEFHGWVLSASGSGYSTQLTSVRMDGVYDVIQPCSKPDPLADYGVSDKNSSPPGGGSNFSRYIIKKPALLGWFGKTLFYNLFSH